MKKYLSVFTVIARESIWRIPVLWAVSALLQTAVFYTNMFSERVLENKIISDAFNAYTDRVGLSYVSCSPFRVPIARLAAAQAAIRNK